MQTEPMKDVTPPLTEISEYTETAAALADLRTRHAGVIFDVTVPKEMRLAREARAELRGLRTSLERKRVEIKAPALDRCRLIDAEAKRITAELVMLEEPIDVQIKLEETRAETERLAKLEAERLRVEAIQQRIDDIRNLAATLVGKPAIIIQGKLATLREAVPAEDEFAEHYVIACDAHAACCARIEQLLIAQREAEDESARIAAERAELARLREDNERMQREAAERAEHERMEREDRERVAQDERDQAEREARKVEQAERDRVAAIAHGEAMRHAAEERQRLADERAEQEIQLQAERESQAQAQHALAAQAEQLRKEKAEAVRQAEAARRAGLGLREAAAAVIDYRKTGAGSSPMLWQLIDDLAVALANDVAPVKPARGKKARA